MERTLHTLTEEFSVFISVNHCFMNVSCKFDSINLFSNCKMMCNQINVFTNFIVLRLIDFNRSSHSNHVIVKA